MKQRASSSAAMDWTMGVFSVLIMAGVFQDGWAHGHGLVDQSFLTPWHAILYGTMAVSGLFLLTTGALNLRKGYSFRNALPPGYWMSAIGVSLFLASGVFDLWWHTMFGIEINVQGLVSISHLMLALGGGLVFAGTLRAVAYQYGPSEGRWSRVGPAILACLAILMLVDFFTQYAAPFNDDTPSAILRSHPIETGGAVYSVRADGTGETRLDVVSGSDANAVTVSPDGKRIAYRLEKTGDGIPPSDIYVANIDGSAARRITNSGRHDTQPQWSPDGRVIAFVSLPANTSGNFRLETVRPDGSGLRTVVDQGTTLTSPSWSPDSRRIAFASRNGITDEIAVVAASGGTVQWLPGTAGGSTPAWSVHGLAFGKDGNVELADVDGRNARTIVSGGSLPQWRSGGSSLTFLRTVDGDVQVFTARADGSQQRNVSQLASMDAGSTAIASNGTVIFTAAGRARAIYTPIGDTYAIDAAIISSIVLTGIVLLLVRRWRIPVGGMTLLLTLFGIAGATQSDLYYVIPVSVAIAIAADLYVTILRERGRSGAGFYVLAFLLPALTFAAFEMAVALRAGLGWAPNLVIGTPFICGFAGLLLSFCFEAPLRALQSQAAAPVQPSAMPPQPATTTSLTGSIR